MFGRKMARAFLGWRLLAISLSCLTMMPAWAIFRDGFETPPDAPPSVLIIAPDDGSDIDGTSPVPVTFIADVRDQEDALAELQTRWTSSVDGFLGTGEFRTIFGGSILFLVLEGELTFNDCFGTSHTITLDVTDSGGNTRTDTIQVTVGGGLCKSLPGGEVPQN